jgi:metal-responsive CopG/Arc/MetJ family transcriptional regulator
LKKAQIDKEIVKKDHEGEDSAVIVNIRVPNELILELDELVKKRVFNSRSEAIREFAREYVHENAVYVQKNAKISEQGGGGW